MDSFVRGKLVEWQLPSLIETFNDEEIDEESFMLLDDRTITSLIPKVGLRVKFLKYHKELVKKHGVENASPSAVHITDTEEATVAAGDNAEDLAITPLPFIQIIPIFNIKEILMASHEGRWISAALEKEKSITIKQRRALVRLLVAFLIEKFGEMPTSDTKKAMAVALIEEFPCLKDIRGNGYEAFYTAGRNHHPATGFIEERLRNIRKRMRKLSRPQRHEEDTSHRMVIPEPTIPTERAQSLVKWLKNNHAPINQVVENMKETALYRAKWIRQNRTKSITEVLHEFPHLLNTPGMISQDFDQVHGETGLKLFESWANFFADRILRIASLVSLGRTFHKVGTNMVEFLNRPESTKNHPFVMVMGNGQQISQAFVIINGQALEQSTLLAAVDLCFKAFYVFDMNYPKQCASTWEFMQHVVFQIEGNETSAVRFLRTSLFAEE
ncbi:uncharacterized protein LOC113106635 [Carassius auratus]|uniref:Uncharacterized protein LOC113106635 n=1 Tax=Carassius auratus TaxID=7957 RepID=A0A6P6PSP9_CARAU|nr:uncharacterized protein LOC113106635 [Carassius auratus]